MKIMFVFVSCLLAISLSVIAAIIGTGHFSLETKAHTDGAVVKEQTASVAATRTQRSGIFAGHAQVVDELVKELEIQIAKNRKAEAALHADKEAFKQKMLQMQLLEKKLSGLRDEVAEKIVQISDNEEGNFKKLAEMYAKMEPENASKLLQQAEPDRAAKIISLIGERQAAAIMNAAVAMGDSGAGVAANWTDAMRRMNNQKKAQL
jgi:flagellar motility protein MotE (MotC chaperone)